MKKAAEYLKIPNGKRIWFHDFRPHFNFLVIDPIKKFTLKMDDILICFVFMSCCIDYLAGFWWGENRDIGGVMWDKTVKHQKKHEPFYYFVKVIQPTKCRIKLCNTEADFTVAIISRRGRKRVLRYFSYCKEHFNRSKIKIKEAP